MSQNAVIKVVGVGGGGCNAVNRMIQAGIQGVEFISMNTDIQSLDASLAPNKVQLGINHAKGLGSGGNPEAGRASAEESREDIRKALENADMVFITCGMGGGTGTGAAHVVASIAKELKALCVAVVTKPFNFEGPKRRRSAEAGISELKGAVDTILTIPNERLLTVVERRTTFEEAFRVADDTLRQGVQGITDIITIPGQINVDFADVKAVMQDAGPAIMGIGYGVGEQRALQAAQAATNSAMLEQNINGARGVLVNITAGPDLTLAETSEAMSYIQELCDSEDADIFFGHVTDPTMDGGIRITVIATGFDNRRGKAEVQAPAYAVAQAPAELQPAVSAVVSPLRETLAQRAAERAAERTAEKVPVASRVQLDTTAIFDDSDLDIPAFIRENRNRS